MSIYDVNYDKIGPQLLPPDKRFPRLLAFLKALLSPLQWARDIWLGSYRSGSDALPWLSSTTYRKYDRVLYKQTVYESLVDNNTDLPTLKVSWMVVQQNFIGVFERVLYNGNRLIFEYAINKYFGTRFRQPPGRSDIYTITYPKPFSVFVVGGTEGNSSVVYANRSTEYIIDAYDFNSFYNMTIFVPEAVFSALDPSSANCEKIIRNYADQYIIAGIIYKIQTY